MITTRREFCALAGAGAWALLRSPAPGAAPVAAPLRVGVLAEAAPRDARVADALEGILFGSEEADRTAALFGERVILVRHFVADPATAAAAVRQLAAGGVPVLLSATMGPAAVAVETAAESVGILTLHLLATPPHRATSAALPWNLWLTPTAEARARALLTAAHEGQVPGLPAGRWPIVAADAALLHAARRLDTDVADSLQRPGLLGEPIPLDGTAGGPTGVVAIAARSPAEAARLLEAVNTSGPRSRRIVDLFGATAGLPHDAVPDGLLRAAAWTPDLERFGAAQLNDRFRARFGPNARMHGAAWSGWFAMKVLSETSLRARATSAAALRDAVLQARFDGHKGRPLAFGPAGRLDHPLYVIGSVH